MIQPNELRIGNWVVLESDISGQKKAIQIDEYWFSSDADQRLSEPIILNHQILEKCGLEALIAKDQEYPFMYCANRNNGDSIDFWVEKGDGPKTLLFSWDKDKDSTIKVQYLHQLQNLYFALTGEELYTEL